LDDIFALAAKLQNILNRLPTLPATPAAWWHNEDDEDRMDCLMGASFIWVNVQPASKQASDVVQFISDTLSLNKRAADLGGSMGDEPWFWAYIDA